MKPEPMTVSDINRYMKDKVAQDEFLNNVYVKGEISNFKHHYTGHMYFTLKDENSLIKCIMFKSSTATLNFVPKDGMQVLILGTVAVFERDGVYQVYCKAMKQNGLGDLYAEYEKLKTKLEKEGFFSTNNKKAIPLYPKVIGVLTSQTGSVIKDIINVSTRRNPNVHIRLFPVPVQGKGAETQIADAIRIMNEKKLADVIILARGGGSLEDLWPFNEEITAKAIYASKIPVISAIGHETDFSISDFVADLRAPTPSAAAEIAVPDVLELKTKIMIYQNRYKTALLTKIQYMKMRYQKSMASRAFSDPLKLINENYQEVDSRIKRMNVSITDTLNKVKLRTSEIISRLDTLSPLKTLTRGYCLATSNGNIIKEVAKLSPGALITIRFFDGEKDAKIIK